MKIIVGAGISGATIARILADASFKVVVLEKRPYIGGNCADYFDEGIMIHKHGPHAFHTSNVDIWKFLSRFTEWIPYEHKVMAEFNNKYVPLPINLTTIEEIYHNIITVAEKSEYTIYDLIYHKHDDLRKLGHWVYDNFYAGYSEKQWGLKINQLPLSIINRVPVRINYDDRYHTDIYQGIPKFGYTAMITKMLECQNITVELNHSVTTPIKGMVYTGSIDDLFSYCHGRLPYRSLNFVYTWSDGQIQRVAQYNYSDIRKKFTRTVEFKHMTDQKTCGNRTVICKEFPTAYGDRYYPIQTSNNTKIHQLYCLMAKAAKISILGRLAQYQYINMDQSVWQAMLVAQRFIER